MEDAVIVFIDSNYWIYLFDETTAEHTHVKNHFKKIIDQYKIAINIPVMIEVMHYLVKRLGANLAKPKWDLFSSMDFIYDDLKFQDLDLIFNELSDYTHTGMGARDASILASMKKLSVLKICTHDKSFKQVSSIEVIDPIP